MIHAPIDRRRLLAGGGAIAAALTVPFGRVMAAAAEELRPIPIPPPISSAERLQRIAKARALMQQNNIGSIVVESGPSLDYLTGVRWWAVHPAAACCRSVANRAAAAAGAKQLLHPLAQSRHGFVVRI